MEARGRGVLGLSIWNIWTRRVARRTVEAVYWGIGVSWGEGAVGTRCVGTEICTIRVITTQVVIRRLKWRTDGWGCDFLVPSTKGIGATLSCRTSTLGATLLPRRLRNWYLHCKLGINLTRRTVDPVAWS